MVSASDNSILAAIKLNDTGFLQLLAENGSLLGSHNSTGQTPLHLAAQLGREDCARILLSAEPNITEQPRDVNGKTPLMMAVEYENLGVAKALLEHGVNVDTVNKQGSALSRAVTYGLADFVKELIDHNAKVENPDYYETPLLYVAARNGDERAIGASLTVSGIDVNVKDSSDGDSPLLAASARGHELIVQMLLDKKVDVHAVNKKGETALHRACFSGHTEAARILLAAGADSDIKLQDSDGDTPLHSASRRDDLGNLEIARELMKNHEGRTPLHLAMAADSDDLFEFLLDAGADFGTADSKGNTILHNAASDGKWKFCHTLVSLRFNAKLEVKNQAGETPLLLAVRQNKPKAVDVLLESGADVNITCRDGTKPLHLACSKGYLEICQTLVSRNADVKSKNKEEKNPLHLAVLNNHLDVVKFLLDCDQAPYVDEVTEDDYTSLHLAAEKGHSRICAALLDHKASMNRITDPFRGYGDTPVMLGASWGQIDCLKVFIGHNVDLNYEYGGYNAIWSAAYSGHVETVKFLLENGASGFPPAVLNGKWKKMTFDSVTEATKSQILGILREAKHT
ncbi:hypothetical protein CkaCkLH20_07204 [Colletotrichum karsti]|uniref:Uncharacterized protein n=1 Tax=Colletotrichum karsti TaxID=1095194 RepID=A0A9P6LGM6_9PEZI|nr:uncharacterized protein CkaCkLH20_07204 [Colletotrichum karsti]KAF9875384.1 hypothetical protein CkaCkLH20_07204 [Colletotrichum karsti]